MPSGKTIGIGLARISEIFTDNIPLTYALLLIVPSVLIIGLRFGLRKTDSFDCFITQLPKPGFMVEAKNQKQLPRSIQYFLDE